MMYEMRLYRRGIILTDTVIYPVSSAPFVTRFRQKTTGAPRLWFNSSSNLIEIHAHSTHITAILPCCPAHRKISTLSLSELFFQELRPGSWLLFRAALAAYKEARRNCNQINLPQKLVLYTAVCMYMVYTWSWVLLRIKCACESSAGLGWSAHAGAHQLCHGRTENFPFFSLRSCQIHTHKHTRQEEQIPANLFILDGHIEVGQKTKNVIRIFPREKTNFK